MSDLPQTEGKNLVEMLDMLKPIPEPEAISMFPATQGWIWLGIVVLALLIWGGLRTRQHWRANAYRRAALAELSQAQDDPALTAQILRRAALVAFPRAEVASLTGAQWLAFLERTCPGKGFASDSATALTRAPWREEAADPSLTAMARAWLKGHKRSPEGAT